MGQKIAKNLILIRHCHDLAYFVLRARAERVKTEDCAKYDWNEDEVELSFPVSTGW